MQTKRTQKASTEKKTEIEKVLPMFCAFSDTGRYEISVLNMRFYRTLKLLFIILKFNALILINK